MEMTPENSTVQFWRSVAGVLGSFLWGATLVVVGTLVVLLIRAGINDNPYSGLGAVLFTVLAIGMGGGVIFLLLAGVSDWLIGQSRWLDGDGVLDRIPQFWAERGGGRPLPDDEWDAIPSEVGVPYAVYLQSDAWQQRRRSMLSRAGRRCQLCNADGNLDVHHRTYERLGAERIGDLTVLCRPCHDVFHAHRRLAG